MLSKRDGSVGGVGVGFIDAFFDWWLPEFLHGARKINFGKEYADRYREEVVSKQGVSRPLSETQVLPCPDYHSPTAQGDVKVVLQNL